MTGCNKLVNHKEEYFRKCAQGRIRSYLRDAKSKLADHVILHRILKFFQNNLDDHKYFACYFDRNDRSSNRLCDIAGDFHCQGKYDAHNCLDAHHINPYDNAESRILFTTWNLDHVIERRTILSSLDTQLNVSCGDSCYRNYFDLLFTRQNLKLVHKSCHVIGPHKNCHVEHDH